MSIHRTPKSGLFLMELSFIILFFAITSAVCVNLFVNARLTSVAGKDLNNAVMEVQTAAESVKHAKGDQKLLAEMLGAQLKEGTLTISYDQDWKPTTEGSQEARYQLSIVQAPMTDDGMLYTEVAVYKGEALVYRVDVGSYVG